VTMSSLVTKYATMETPSVETVVRVLAMRSEDFPAVSALPLSAQCACLCAATTSESGERNAMMETLEEATGKAI
jgi:hypothetical protein